MNRTPLAAFTLAVLLSPAGGHTEPVIELADTGHVRVSTQQDDVRATLDALAAKLGFSVSGQLEQPRRAAPAEQRGRPGDVIKQLVSPQSVAIVHGRTADGAAFIRRVELLDTGTQETQFRPSDEGRTAPLTGGQGQIENRMRHNERRAVNRAKRLEEGSLVWTEEGRRRQEERRKRREQNESR